LNLAFSQNKAQKKCPGGHQAELADSIDAGVCFDLGQVEDIAEVCPAFLGARIAHIQADADVRELARQNANKPQKRPNIEFFTGILLQSHIQRHLAVPGTICGLDDLAARSLPALRVITP
jgi:hypothetical protein